MTRSVGTGLLHHVELWVPDLRRTTASWGWLLEELGYQAFQCWDDGISFRLGPTYLVFERSPDLEAGPHQRTRAGLNHLAFHAGNRASVEVTACAALVRTASTMPASAHAGTRW